MVKIWKAIIRKMFTKNLFLILLFIPSFLFCQEFSFDVNTNEGFIETIYIRDDYKVFKISETIDEIYIFGSDSLAKNYLQTLNKSIIPKKKFQLGETAIFVNSVAHIEYYTNSTPLSSLGKIKSINDLTFNYAPEYSWNRNSGVTGKLIQIGNIKITYWTDAGYTEKGKYRGKIKSFGNKEFKYEGWSSWGEKAGMVGRLISIGSIKINYYETDYDKGYKGKLKSISTIEFIYYGESTNNKKAKIVGKLKQQTGQDERITVH